MRKDLARLAAGAFAGLVLFSASPAESGVEWRGSGGWGAGLPYSRLYQSATVQSRQGKVLKVKKLVPAEGMSDGWQLVLQTRDETLFAHLGPVWYLERQDFPVTEGDLVEITGSRVVFEGMPTLIAAGLRKGDKALTLREEKSGFPLWSAWRRR